MSHGLRCRDAGVLEFGLLALFDHPGLSWIARAVGLLVPYHSAPRVVIPHWNIQM